MWNDLQGGEERTFAFVFDVQIRLQIQTAPFKYSQIKREDRT